jgi:hypothetical protein
MLAIVFAALWLVAGTAALLFHQLTPWWFARQIIREDPSLSVVPVPLEDKSVAAIYGLRIERLDFSLQVPWNEIEGEQTSKTISNIAFKEGGILLIFNPSDALDTVKMVRGKEETAKDINQLLGARALSSNYDLMAAELATKPSQVKWWGSRNENVRSLLLLNLKSMELHHLNAIYPIASQELHGFQLGNPAVAPYKVEIDLFDREDRRYQILIHGRDGRGPILTQPEINAMVASLQPIPHS